MICSKCLPEVCDGYHQMLPFPPFRLFARPLVQLPSGAAYLKFILPSLWFLEKLVLLVKIR